ncbi:MAG TPA: M20/M25/M40 family metallo-hydrolase [Fimbriimonadaceae bacterium]|nr:M20/M25/M40 family metallo-hydrolase [Fimbriimonadaceae bacterium]
MVVPQEISDRILAECLNRPLAYSELQWLCDNVGGRTSGAESGRKAEEWGRRYFTSLGLDRVRFEELPVTVWERGSLEVAVLEPAQWRVTAMAHGNAPSKFEGEAEVLDAGHAEKGDFERLGGAVKGKIVLCDEGVASGHRALHRTEKLKLSVDAGAAGLMIYSSASGGLPRTGVCYYGEAPIPSMGISQEDGERLKRLIQGGTTPSVRIAMRNSNSTGTARNVIADITGSEKPEEVVMAGGHLDSWDISQGATDNGLGSAIVMEMAHALSALGKRPRRTLRFVLWAAEEVGLCGSKAYAAAHAGELDDMCGLLNFDMTGDPFGFWSPGRPEKHEMLSGLAEQLAGLGMKADYEHKAGLHSDHQAFMLEGVPTFALMAKLEGQGGHYYHSVGDTFEKVSLPSLCRAAAVGAHLMWAIADAPARPFARLDREEIEKMIDDADLREALAVEQ